MPKMMHVNIVAPDKLALEAEAEFVAVPGYAGELGVLPGHAPLLAQLQPGVIRLKQGENTKFFAVSGGFIEVGPTGVDIFAETAEGAEEIDEERARHAAERAKSTLAGTVQGEDLARAQAALQRALLRLRVAEGIRRKPH